MRLFIFSLIIATNFVRCQDITITKEYIQNDYWNDKYNNRIHIERLIPTSDSLHYYAKEYGWVEKDEFYKVDSSFMYSYSGLNYKEQKIKLKDKVYFNKNNGWKWYVKGKGVEAIGNLENDTWYKFSDLKMNGAFYVYVYVDKKGKVHQYEINLANY